MVKEKDYPFFCCDEGREKFERFVRDFNITAPTKLPRKEKFRFWREDRYPGYEKGAFDHISFWKGYDKQYRDDIYYAVSQCYGDLKETIKDCLIALFALGSVGFYYSTDYVLNNILETHQQKRIRVLLGLEDDPRGAGYNVIQAKIAIGSGGLQGKGFLNGTQTKLKYVPEQDTDFIFCTVGEEEGFVGCAIVLLLFLSLILRLLHLAERQAHTFGRVYGYCVLSIFLFHVFINVGMVLGLTPVIGIPLPFFSYGGSSLWGFTILLFVFLRIDAGRNRLQH